MEWLLLLDNLQIILRSITYLEIVYWGIRYYKDRLILMPLLANILNLAWEINALILFNGFWGHLIWLTLDVFITMLNAKSIRNKKKRLLFYLLIIGITFILRLVFVIPDIDGMLISVFAIDLIMAVDFVVNAKKISGHGKIPIAITKLLGDLFAWFANSSTIYVNFIGIIVFLVNLYYLSVCLELDTLASKQKKERRKYGPIH